MPAIVVEAGDQPTNAGERAADRHTPLSLHIGIEHDAGGAGRVLSELMHCLPAAGIRFRGLVSSPRDSFEQTAGAITCFSEPGAKLPRRLRDVRRATRTALHEWQPDLIASHFAMYAAPALDLLKSRALVSHFHGPWSAESREEGASELSVMAKAHVEAAVYRRSQRVIVLSRAFERVVVADFKVDPQRVRLVPGSVDTARFDLQGEREASRLALGLPLDRPVLVSVRRLVHRMGLTTLLEAMRAVVARVPDVLLCLAGSGPLRGALEAQIEALNLTEHVRLLGFVPEADLPHLYYAADFNLVPTAALEGFGLVAAEAMATGTPSFVTPVGGLPEIVGELSSELIFASCGAGDISESIIQALQGTLHLPTRSACREHIQRNFTSALMARRTAAVYLDLLHERE